MAVTPQDKPVTNAWAEVLSGAGTVGIRGNLQCLVVMGGSLPTDDTGAMELMRLGGVNNSDTASKVYARTIDAGETGALPVWKV